MPLVTTTTTTTTRFTSTQHITVQHYRKAWARRATCFVVLEKVLQDGAVVIELFVHVCQV